MILKTRQYHNKRSFKEIKKMDWNDVEEIIFNGDKQQVDSLRCPDCGNRIEITVSKLERYNTIEIRCNGCGYLSRGFGGPMPKYIEE